MDAEAIGARGAADVRGAQARGGAHPWLGVGVLLLAAGLWSLNGPLIKLLHADEVPAISMACLRSLIGGLAFLPFALRRMHTVRNVRPRWIIGTVLAFTVMTAAFVQATTMTAAASAIILQYTSAIWVFLLSPLLLKERPGWTEGLALVLAMLGMGVILLGTSVAGGADAAAGAADAASAPAIETATGAVVLGAAAVPGLLIALLSGLGYGALTVGIRGLRRVDAVVVTMFNALGSGLLLAGPMLLWGTLALSARAWLLVLALSFVQFTLPYVLFAWGLKHVEAHRAALIVLIEAILNPLWTFLIVGERVPGPTLAGGPLILAGVAGWLLLSWRRERRERRAALAPLHGLRGDG